MSESNQPALPGPGGQGAATPGIFLFSNCSTIFIFIDLYLGRGIIGVVLKYYKLSIVS